MKNIFVVILLCLAYIGLQASDQPVRKISKDGGTKYQWISNPTDSGATDNSQEFDATPILAYYLRGDRANYTARDTNFALTLHSNVIFANTLCSAGGSVDSISLLVIQGKMSDGTWVTFDTLRTKGTTRIASLIPFYSTMTAPAVFYTDWRFRMTVADITASSYSLVCRVEIFVPSTGGSGGGVGGGIFIRRED